MYSGRTMEEKLAGQRYRLYSYLEVSADFYIPQDRDKHKRCVFDSREAICRLRNAYLETQSWSCRLRHLHIHGSGLLFHTLLPKKLSAKSIVEA